MFSPNLGAWFFSTNGYPQIWSYLRKEILFPNLYVWYPCKKIHQVGLVVSTDLEPSLSSTIEIWQKKTAPKDSYRNVSSIWIKTHIPRKNKKHIYPFKLLDAIPHLIALVQMKSSLIYTIKYVEFGNAPSCRGERWKKNETTVSLNSISTKSLAFYLKHVSLSHYIN